MSTPAQAAVDADATSDAALNRRLMPLYLVFVLDAIGLGVALPVLPFFVMGLKATALQLAIVVSSNYIAQTFGEERGFGARFVSMPLIFFAGVLTLWNL